MFFGEVGVARGRVGLRVDVVDEADRAEVAGRLAELLPDLVELLHIEPPSREPQHRADDVGMRKAVQHRDDIGKALVKRRNVEMRGVVEVRAESVEQGVRALVGHDVVTQAREDVAAGEVPSDAVLGVGLEVAEIQLPRFGVVVGVPVTFGDRADAQAERGVRGARGVVKAPCYGPA